MAELDPAPYGYAPSAKELQQSKPSAPPPPPPKRRNKFAVVVLSVSAGCVLAAVTTAATLGCRLERERIKLLLERERLERERQRNKGHWWRSIVGTVVTVTVKIALGAVMSNFTGGANGGMCSSRDADCGRVIVYNDNQVNFIGGNNQLMSN